jgi:ABC-type multidrug transport system permease subunit
MLSKERQSRSYRLLSYFLSKQIAELPLILFNPTIFTVVLYWASGLLPDFGRFIAYLIVILLTTLTAQGFGYLFGATLLDIQKSICKYQNFNMYYVVLSRDSL